MERGCLTEVHYITPLANLPSILERGLLSHQRVATIEHVSIADGDVQDRRRGKRVPNGRPLHEYVNTYVDARNPMMFRRRSHRHQLCILRIEPDVLDIPGTVIVDGNAASPFTRFAAAPAGLEMLDEQRVYATYWTNTDHLAQKEKERQRCAEVLVPDRVPVEYIVGCYVCTDGVARACGRIVPDLEVVVSARVFFG